jgi:hypothetical protein
LNWGLRDYGIEPIIWDGVEGCEHEWGAYITDPVHPKARRCTKCGRFGITKRIIENKTITICDNCNNLITESESDTYGLKSQQGKKRWQHGEIKTEEVKQGNFCLKCSAWRGSLGLEPTFELYIKHLCDIFDQVKRVMRKDGTCFVNLGDSYSGSGKAGNNPEYQSKHTEFGKPSIHTERFGMPTTNIGIPSKSLCLIPQRFAIEMTKRRGFIIPNENNRAWLAGIIEGEGCIHIHKRTGGRKNPTYGVFLSIHNTNINMIERIKQLTGLKDNVQTTNKDRGFTLYRWNAMSNNGKNILREVYPYLVTKRDQARCAIYCPSSGKEAEECWVNIKRMHNYQEVNREYPEPQIGGIDPWILRNTIIWKKPNCMPSSANDRFTVDFEYLFFFVKSKSYWFEQQFENIKAESKERYKYAFKGNKAWRDDPNSLYKDYQSMEHSEQGRNKRCVWTIPTQPFPEAHFATFPEKLIETPIKAGCPQGGIVLDPFSGAGTTAVVAKKQGKKYIGIELKQEYIDMANKRLRKIAERLF